MSYYRPFYRFFCSRRRNYMRFKTCRVQCENGLYYLPLICHLSWSGAADWPRSSFSGRLTITTLSFCICNRLCLFDLKKEKKVVTQIPERLVISSCFWVLLFWGSGNVPLKSALAEKTEHDLNLRNILTNGFLPLPSWLNSIHEF